MSAKRPHPTITCKTCDRPFSVHYFRRDTAQFCSRACKGAYRLHRGFWECLDMSGGPNACWEWQANRQHNGYGVIKSGGKNMIASRIVYAAVYGPIPPGLFVLHHCDNPPCCNPVHLFLGTTQDNSLDALHKGRLKGQYLPGHIGLRGHTNSHAKLTEDNVRYIRAMRGQVTQRVLAVQLGIAVPTVSAIQLHRIWKHL
jgi:hypothetical protein